jgi:UDP-glucose 4-epimerase
MSETVLVTGVAGYIGSHTALALLAGGFDVVGIDDLSTGRRSMVPDGVAFTEADVCDGATVARCMRDHGCTAVIHFAGAIVNPESFAVPLDYYRVNVGGLQSVLDACVETGVTRIIFSSSAAVYGAAANNPIPEDAPKAPVSPYGRSKLIGEWLIEDAARAHGLSYAMLRYFNVAGADPEGRAGQVGPATHLIKIATEAALGLRDGMTVFGTDYDTPDGTCIRDYLHVSDLADAHVLALRHLIAEGRNLILNCGYDRGFSVREVIDAVGRRAGTPLSATPGARRVGDVATLVADSDLVRKTLDWQPRYDDLDTIIDHALTWERLNHGAQ